VASSASALAIRSLRCPGPTTASPLLATMRPLDEALAPPWVFVRPHRYIDARPDSRSIPSPTQAPTFHRRRSPRLGPRSLDADRPFWSALPSLFEARCRLPTSATAYYDVRTRTQTLSFLAGTEAKTSFLFLRVIAFSLAGAVTRGEPRCVRSIEPRCRFLLVAQVCPTSMLDRPRHLRRAS